MSEAPPASALAHDVLCIACGYNLRGLDPAGRCPECALPVANSRRGETLAFADPAWLRKLRFGASLKLWNILIMVLMVIAGAVVVGVLGGPVQVMIVLGVLGALLGLWATFCITAQEPRIALIEDPVTLRKIIRACAVIACVGAMLNQLGGIALAPGSTLRGANLAWAVLSLLAALAGLVVTIGELKYFRRFALRMPDLKLARATRIVMWGMGIAVGLTTIGSAIVSLLFASTFAAAAAATGAGTTTITSTGPGYTATTWTAPPVAPTTGSPPATMGAPTPPAALAGALFAGAGMCVFMAAMAVFGLWYISLLSRYRKLFQAAIDQSMLAPAPAATSPV